MSTLTNELIGILLGTSNSLEYACEVLNIDELSEDEISELYEYIFDCGYCGYWHEAAEGTFEPVYGLVCEDCLNTLMEYEDGTED